MVKNCSVTGCERKHRTLGYCEFHWKKSDKYKKSKKKSDVKYYEKNKEAIHKTSLIYREKNRDEILAQKRKAYSENREENIRKRSEARNLKKTSTSNFHKHLPEETRRKLSESLKGRLSPNKGKKASEETRNKLSESHKGKKPSDETRKKMSGKTPWNKGKKGQIAWNKGKKGVMPIPWNKGKPQTEEERRKNSESHKGQIPWITGKKHLEESKAKMREKRQYQVMPRFDTIPEKMMQKALTLENIVFQKHKLFKIGNTTHRVDIFIEPNICIEVDGIYYHSRPYELERDKKIDAELKSKGFQVIRFVAPTKNKDFDVKSNAEKIKNIIDRMN